MPDEIPQPISPEIPAPQDPVSVAENIPETQPISLEEIKSEPTPTQKIPQPEPTPQISVDPINPNIIIEKTPDTVTITEVMEPKAPVPEVSKGTFDTKTFLASLLPKLKEKLSFRTEKRLAKIMELARKNGEIQNDEIEKLLHVSDASASRYLSKLVQRGSLRVSGPKNHSKYLPT